MRKKRPYFRPIPEIISIGDIIYPDNENKPIAVWPGKDKDWVAKIRASKTKENVVEAVTDTGPDQKGFIVFLDRKPKLGEKISITKVTPGAADGKMMGE